ncbi:hypothetical protein MRY82_10135 [bacterium]|nr:hypothetical protein [bacterium]
MLVQKSAKIIFTTISIILISSAVYAQNSLIATEEVCGNVLKDTIKVEIFAIQPGIEISEPNPYTYEGFLIAIPDLGLYNISKQHIYSDEENDDCVKEHDQNYSNILKKLEEAAKTEQYVCLQNVFFLPQENEETNKPYYTQYFDKQGFLLHGTYLITIGSTLIKP